MMPVFQMYKSHIIFGVFIVFNVCLFIMRLYNSNYFAKMWEMCFYIKYLNIQPSVCLIAFVQCVLSVTLFGVLRKIWWLKLIKYSNFKIHIKVYRVYCFDLCLCAFISYWRHNVQLQNILISGNVSAIFHQKAHNAFVTLTLSSFNSLLVSLFYINDKNMINVCWQTDG